MVNKKTNKSDEPEENGGGPSDDASRNGFSNWQRCESRKMDFAVLIYRLETARCLEEHRAVLHECVTTPDFERVLQQLPGERIVRFYNARDRKMIPTTAAAAKTQSIFLTTTPLKTTTDPVVEANGRNNHQIPATTTTAKWVPPAAAGAAVRRRNTNYHHQQQLKTDDVEQLAEEKGTAAAAVDNDVPEAAVLRLAGGDHQQRQLERILREEEVENGSAAPRALAVVGAEGGSQRRLKEEEEEDAIDAERLNNDDDEGEEAGAGATTSSPLLMSMLFGKTGIAIPRDDDGRELMLEKDTSTSSTSSFPADMRTMMTTSSRCSATVSRCLNNNNSRKRRRKNSAAPDQLLDLRFIDDGTGDSNQDHRRHHSGLNQFGRLYNPGLPLELSTRHRIIELYQAGTKVNAIAKQLSISHGCVSKILSRFKTTGDYGPPGGGRHRTVVNKACSRQ